MMPAILAKAVPMNPAEPGAGNRLILASSIGGGMKKAGENFTSVAAEVSIPSRTRFDPDNTFSPNNLPDQTRREQRLFNTVHCN